MSIRIAIADDHLMVLNGLEKMLEGTNVEIINTYQNGKALLEGLNKSLPDVVLLDIQMPVLSGEHVMPELKKLYPDLPVLIITGFDDSYYMDSILQAGAMGYILKSSNKEIILEAIEAVATGKKYIDPAIEIKTSNTLRHATPHIQKLQLSPREREVLKLTVNGLSSTEIADALFLGKRTIENYRMSLLIKLDVKNVAMLVKKAIEMRLV